MLRFAKISSIGSKQFHEQLAHYLDLLKSGDDPIYSATSLGEILGMRISRDQLEKMQEPLGEDSGLAPNESFATKFARLLMARGILRTPAESREFTGGADAARKMAENRSWRILNTSAIFSPAADHLQASEARIAAAAFNPRGMPTAKSARQILEEAYGEGKTFSAFIDALMLEWKIPHAVALTAVVNTNINRHIHSHETITADMVRQWRNDEHRTLERAPIEQTQLFCKAFGFEDAQQRMIWRMMRGRMFALDDYRLLEAEAVDAKNPGVLVEGLIHASGIPKSVIEDNTGANRLPENVKGIKFDNLEKAQRFMAYVFPAALSSSDVEDSDIISCQQRGAHLVAHIAALPPVALTRIAQRPNAHDLLEITLEKGGNFADYLRTLSTTWEVSPSDLREIVAYGYHKAKGENKTVWESTFKQWMNPQNTQGYGPNSDSLVTLRIGLGLSEKDEMNLWYLIAGRPPQEIPALMKKAADGDTGPLVKELVAASGIPTGYMENIIPTSQLHEWMNGTKIGDKDTAERFLILTYPPQRRENESPDPQILTNQAAILKALVYVQIVSDETKKTHRDHAKEVRTNEWARVASVVVAKPFAAILEATTKERGGWHDTINAVLDTWAISPRQFGDILTNANGTSSGGNTVSVNAVHSWKDSPEIQAIAPLSVAALVKGFKLTELQELQIWKQKAGRYLEPDEIQDTIVSLKHGAPGPLISLQMESSGIQESRFKKLLNIAAIDKWFDGGYIKSPETARRLVEVTMGVERLLMDEVAQKKFDTETANDLVRAHTGRPLSVSDIIKHGYDGVIPRDGHEFLRALCGPRGLKTLSDLEFSVIADINEWETRQVRRGSHVLNVEQARRVLTHFDEKNLDPQAINILTTKPRPRDRTPSVAPGSYVPA